MTFKELNISQPILKALCDKNFTQPTPIQEQAIPIAINGEDLLGIAQTGTGKTAAFAIPIIEQLIINESKSRKIKALILTPTRELAIQIEEEITLFAKYTSLRHTVIFGGVNQRSQTNRLKNGTDILIATPGRLLDLINQGYISLNSISHFVLDEADRMLDMGFIHDIKKIINMLPKKRQTMLFSATMPKEILNISKAILCNPKKVEVTPESSVIDTIEQRLFYVEKPKKIDLLVDLLKREREKSVLIFSRTKHLADRIAKTLNSRQLNCQAIHGNKSQSARQNALSNFKSGKIRIIVATDIASRGIDINNLGLVINYDLPDVPETYVHRIGRTGRAGNSGLSYTFCTKEENGLLKNIQKLIGKKIEEYPISA